MCTSQLLPTMAFCPECGNALAEFEISVPCEFCRTNQLAWGEGLCANCGTQFPSLYWLERVNEGGQREIFFDDQDLADDDWQLALGENPWDSINICCDRYFTDCDCAHWISPEEIGQISRDLYDPDGGCDTCIHEGEASCPSLRAAVKELFEAGVSEEELELIAICSNYTPSQEEYSS